MGLVLALTLVVLALPAPWAADLDRFPTLDACHARIRVLIEQRHQLHLAPPSTAQRLAVQRNGHALTAWETLLEARGGCAEEGVEVDAGRALERLMMLLGDADWRAGRMP